MKTLAGAVVSLSRGAAAALAFLAASTALADRAQAQAYPAKPIRLVLPYSPGGINRLRRPHARPDARRPARAAGDRREPARRGRHHGTDSVARSPADGYTIVLMDPAIVINPTLQPSMPYDLFKQLTTVSIVSSSPLVLVVAPELPIKTFDDLVRFGKANPGKLNFASAGIGTTPNLAGELLKLRTGVDATHIPYKSIGQSYPDLMSNKVQFAFSSIAGALPFTTDNRVAPSRRLAPRAIPCIPICPRLWKQGFPASKLISGSACSRPPRRLPMSSPG